MTSIINATGLSKRYGDFKALDNVSLKVEPGRIVGLIGPNGAGKTTALRCLLGLSTFDGELTVLGKRPDKDRISLLNDVAYIADTAVLPTWIQVNQLLEYMQSVHPKFNRAKAQTFLDQTEIKATHKVSQLSKGMVTQLHLAVAISIDAKLLVLDEPTLGLDIIYRKRFYEQLLNDYFDEGRTILITTHQVEEVEQLLTDLVFIQKGQIVLDITMEEVTERFIEVEVPSDKIEQARALRPISERTTMGGVNMLYENIRPDQIEGLGKARIPSVADLFVAKMS
ncbi:MAG: ABC-2 type transport system ATP-binding protein [Arenicella sp.]|jgi:ABC-2 type transport system ATP-binding protein